MARRLGVGGQSKDAETEAWPFEAGQPDVASEKPEDGAEHVLPLGDPRHRFDVERVDREERGNQCAPPEAIRHSQEQQEEQQHGAGMEHDVRRVKSACGWTERFRVKLQGDPRKRVPVGLRHRRKRPDDAVAAETGQNVRVFRDVGGVVEIDEVKRRNARVDGHRRGDQ